MSARRCRAVVGTLAILVDGEGDAAALRRHIDEVKLPATGRTSSGSTPSTPNAPWRATNAPWATYR